MWKQQTPQPSQDTTGKLELDSEAGVDMEEL
ncbi:hypothetical protein MFFC18_30150 [Mariniblastus fucicola]|uniref:Uncharacterized protein n=1 Tax=Mariniblastus fucicola TaxID=980251 RepID=A0A5B9PDF0_9BACT|nr:hypothetical protein MFFC18_30150 [Mariniblastus fucicola]